ncbi:hypothetical protein AM493_15160 [Flavobacterium akiainvivens]|uniref:Uncharacterized protein n=1 Tax=Flavobacterium akiainvivens TaxID=1202724 RepID=A0A0M8MCE1_9FLAO|nr:hypothetical protein AM493_15160 [Flavobacterium akiainvivens]
MSSLYFELSRTFEALVSILEPVWFCLLTCESAEPAKDLAVAEAFGFVSVFEAKEATEDDVFLLFIILRFEIIIIK